MELRSRAFPILGLGLSAVLMAWAIFAIAVGDGNRSNAEPLGIADAQQTFAGILQDGNQIGSNEAPVSISLFTDLQCPSCADWFLETIPPLVASEVRNDDVALQLRHFSVGPIPRSVSAIAASAAGEQGDQWQYAYILMANIDQAPQQGIDIDYLRDVAASVPGQRFDPIEWADAYQSGRAEDIVDVDRALSDSMRLTAESAVVVDGPGGSKQLEGSPSLEQIRAAIESVR